MSLFFKDIKKESILSGYLDKIYKEMGYKYTRVTDLKEQYKGIDLIIEKNGVEYKIDEKAQLDYLNNSLPTIAFELFYYKNGIRKRGWLFDHEKLTDHYFYITSIRSAKSTLESIEDIKDVKIYSVDRQCFIKCLTKCGINEDYCKDILSRIYKNKNKVEYIFNDGIKFVFSPQKSESPLNLVIYLNRRTIYFDECIRLIKV